jgi:hypothetical protein
VEIRDSVAQKREEVLKFLADHAALLARQGSVQESWRLYRGERLGPYFRLLYRRDRKQQNLYLGADRALAEEVRTALEGLQAPLRERRELARLRAQARAALRAQKRELDQELRRLGAHLKGFEVRGWRNVVGPFRAGLRPGPTGGPP